MSNSFHGVTPILNVTNFGASMEYYVNQLGFTQKWAWGEPSTFGCVARDQVSISYAKARRAALGHGS